MLDDDGLGDREKGLALRPGEDRLGKGDIVSTAGAVRKS